MASRLELQQVLETILGSKNVYYQPPSTVKMSYPAIVYSRDNINARFANNKIYTINKTYEIIVIDRNPDSLVVDKVALLPSCKFSRNYTADNLNHDAFTILF